MSVHPGSCLPRRRGAGRVPARVAAGLAALVGLVAPGPGGPAGPRVASADDAPTPEAPATRNVDAWVAHVCGETVTRRMLMREIGPPDPEEPEAAYERRLRQNLVSRTVNAVMVWKAKLFGLDPRPSVVDEFFEKEAAEVVKRARKRDPGITFAQVLAQREQSVEEFKALLARQIVVDSYWAILINGSPGSGKRPQVDIEPSPAECRRLYDAHRAEFDQAAGVRLASFFANPERFLDTAGSFEAAVAAARARVASLVGEVARGKSPEDVARAAGLKAGEWSETPEGSWFEKGKGTTLVEEVDAWALEPARRRGDTKVVDGPRGELAGYVVLDVQRAEQRRYEDALPKVMARIRRTRVLRFRMQHMLETLAAAPVRPPSLVEEISDQLRVELKKLDENPVDREIRLR